jgi:hypothetical protein
LRREGQEREQWNVFHVQLQDKRHVSRSVRHQR